MSIGAVGSAWPLQMPPAVAGGTAGDTDPAEACRSFEAYFIAKMLEAGPAAAPPGMTGGGAADGIYSYVWRQTLANAMAEGSGMGLARELAGALARGTAEGEQHGC